MPKTQTTVLVVAMIGQQLEVWIGGVWNGQWPLSRCLSEAEFCRKILEFPQTELSLPNVRLRSLTFQSLKKCNSIPAITQESSIAGELNRPLTPTLLKSIANHLPFLSRPFTKVCPLGVYTPAICIALRLPFLSQYFFRSIRVRGRWNTQTLHSPTRLPPT